MQYNIPTLLTLFRVVLIPFFVLAFYLPVVWAPFACALIFLIAAVTDWFDGYLARRWNQSTRFGAFLDPVADKVMVAIAMVLVAEHYHTWWVTLPAATICGNSSVGRARPCQGRGREFESRFPLQIKDMRNSGCQLEKFYGALAKRLCSGLQIRLVRFDSGTRLHFLPEPGWWNR